MNQQEATDIRLWAFIEGSDSEAAHDETLRLIQSSGAWKAAYDEALLTHNALKGLTTAEPSMRFTRNVMDVIGKVRPVYSRAYFNPWVVRGIAAVFMLLFAILLVMGISSVSWSDGASVILPDVITKRSFFNQHAVTALWPWFIFANIIGALVLVDALHHRRQRLADMKEL